jgi:SOS-response transcriptional repressor LexA
MRLKQDVQDRVLRFIIEYKRKSGGIPPSFREITDSCGISSTSVCKTVLNRLQDQGKIDFAPTAHTRNIQVVGEEYSVK